jgi:antitoxin ParD1/3/4
MATTTMRIAIPEEMMMFIEVRIRSGHVGNVAEYVRHLVREDAKRAQEERLVALLQEGERSGDLVAMDDQWRARHRDGLMKKVRKVKRKKHV